MVMRLILSFGMLCLALSSVDPARADRVATAIDGDTFRIGDTFFRLQNIDTPERGEKNYNRAKKILQNWLDRWGKKGLYRECDYVGRRGKYGRYIVSCPAIEIKLKLLNLGEWYETGH